MVNRALDVVFLGPPGAGKGTQARRVARAFNVAHISTGDLLRDEVSRGTELGRGLQEIMASGSLAPDTAVTQLVVARLHSQRGVAGCVFDGYPRSVSQAHLLDGLLAELGRRVDAALVLEVDDNVIVERLSGRRSCPECGAIYHVIARPSELNDRCEQCEGVLEQRNDDREDVVLERIRVYRECARPLLALYEQRGLLRSVDGLGSEDEVFQRVRRAMRSGRQ